MVRRPRSYEALRAIRVTYIGRRQLRTSATPLQIRNVYSNFDVSGRRRFWLRETAVAVEEDRFRTRSRTISAVRSTAEGSFEVASTDDDLGEFADDGSPRSRCNRGQLCSDRGARGELHRRGFGGLLFGLYGSGYRVPAFCCWLRCWRASSGTRRSVSATCGYVLGIFCSRFRESNNCKPEIWSTGHPLCARTLCRATG